MILAVRTATCNVITQLGKRKISNGAKTGTLETFARFTLEKRGFFRYSNTNIIGHTL